MACNNVSRSADPTDARRHVEEALSWDLGGRVAHHWLRHGNRSVSTLDLLGDGLTLLTGPTEPGWERAAAALNTRAPLTVPTVDQPAAHSIGIQPSGANLLCPNGQPLTDWPTLTEPLHGGDLPAHFRHG